MADMNCHAQIYYKEIKMKAFKYAVPVCIALSMAMTGCSDGASENLSSEASESHATTENSTPETDGATAESTDNGTELYEAEYAEARRQQDISQPVEYLPVAKTKDVRYGNLPQNLTSDILPGLVCPDAETGTLYFTNLSDGETLCKLENGVITEILPVTAKSINLWDGSLYYICDTENPVGIPKFNGEFRTAYTGDIYRYDLATGETTLLIETDAYRLVVSEYGLDWSAGVNYSCEKYTFGTSEHYYHADIDGGNITENAEFPIIDDWLGLYYGDYQTETADGAIVLRDMQSGETVPVLSHAETLDYSAIVGDILYYCPNFRNYRMNESGNIVSKNTLCGIDLSTGESFTVAKTAYMTDYAIVGDTAYICGGLNFSVYRDGNQLSGRLELHGFNDSKHEFIALYTDGENLYAADDRKGIYIVEPNDTQTGLRYYDIGGEPWGTEE